MKLVWCLAVLAFGAAIQATAADASDEDWQNDYDIFYDYSDENNNDKVVDKDENTDQKVKDEILEFLQQDQEKTDAQNHKDFGPLLDYQFEDNRSNTDEKEVATKKFVDDTLPEEPILQKSQSNHYHFLLEPLQPGKFSKENDDDENTDLFGPIWNEEEDAPLPVPKSNKESSTEVKQALKETSSNESFSAEKETLDQFREETSKLLQEINAVDLNSTDDKNSNDGMMEVNNNDDTPEKVLRDLSADIDKLFETLDKLNDNQADADELFEHFNHSSENDSEFGDQDEAFNDTNVFDDVQDYEEKYKRPYGEGYILSLREDYDNFNEKNMTDTSDEEETEQDENINEQEIPVVEDHRSRTVTSKTDKEPKEATASVNDSGKTKASGLELSSEIGKIDYDALVPSLEDSEEDQKRYYGNDGLVNDEMPKNEDAEVFITSTRTPITENVSVTKDVELTSTKTEESTAPTEEEKTKEVVSTTEADVKRVTLMVTDLNSDQYDDLMIQFGVAHDDELHVKNDKPPKREILSVDEPTIITSPDHPERYPRNTIIDWILEGPGIGIEMNMTALRVNGMAGEYVLVKPGGVNASGSDGLIFSFELREVRRYRFTNVNHMFVRFESKSAVVFSGFSMSVKMMLPPQDYEQDDVPEPEAVLRPPNGTLTLSLAGLTLVQFHNVKSDFKELIADMATEYIKDNNIDPGLNTTLDVTQIMRTAVCNIRWPNYETCVEVTFGVALQYEDEEEDPKLDAKDLEAMWRSYIVEEPFASRLRNMGITEYAIPNDRSVLMMWLLIATGVIIGMALLGFALWRFSCFEDYTRMKSFNDSDSVQDEKRNLDLYPTPHQTLPPLYSDNDYKWADEKYEDTTRVDMSSFANKSYIRDDLFELDSDEEIIAARDRKGVIIGSKESYDASI